MFKEPTTNPKPSTVRSTLSNLLGQLSRKKLQMLSTYPKISNKREIAATIKAVSSRRWLSAKLIKLIIIIWNLNKLIPRVWRLIKNKKTSLCFTKFKQLEI